MADVFVCVPDFEKAAVPLRKPCILTWAAGNVDFLVREFSQIRLYTNRLNVYGSVHHINILFHIIPTRYTIHRVYFYLTLLYMFRASLSPIVRSTKQL